MFDPAILMSLEASMPPQPPIFAEERVWQSPEGAAAARVGEKLTRHFDEQANAWLAQLDAIKQQAQSVAIGEVATPDELRQLSDLIDEFETHADLRAKGIVRLTKRIRRDVKAHFRVDPSLGAATRAVGDRLIATDKRIVEGLLSYALFLRALRADGDPDSRGGRTFDTPDDLGAYLDSLVAA